MVFKKILKSIWNEFVYGGHLLALGAVSIVYTSAVLLNIKITWDFLVITYLGVYTPYLYNRYKEFNKDFLTNPDRTEHIKNYVKYIPLIITFFLIIILGIFLYFNKTGALLFAIFLLFLSFSYSVLFKGFSKKIIGFKNFYISLSWALLSVLLVIYYSFSLNLALFLILIFVFLRFFLSTIFFDIKDVESDKKEGLLTLPVVLKRKGLINVLSVMNIITITPMIIGFFLKIFPLYSLILLFVVFYSFYYFYKLTKDKVNTNFLYYVIVDGEFVLWTPIILLGKILL